MSNPVTNRIFAVGVRKIVNDYDAVIMSRKSRFSDVSELPYPKPVIKAALLASISVTKNTKMREQLKTSFVSLADWQEGVAALGPDPFSQVTPDEDIKASAKRIFEKGQPFVELGAKAVSECKALLEELEELKARGL